MANQTRQIEVFRIGSHQPMTGPAISFSHSDLVSLTENYDANGAPTPVVIGHPKTDDPAFGWVKAFSVSDDGKLLADIDQLEPNFVEAVSSGRYKKISISLYGPDAPNNPTPGHYYPKHIGFLGAAAPAVSGLSPVAFAGDDDECVTFEFADRAFKDVASVLRSLRDFMIEQFGLEQADRALSGWEIKWIDDAGDVNEPATPRFVAPTSKSQDIVMTTQPSGSADFATREADIAKREADIAKREADLAKTDNVSFAEGLISEGKLLPIQKDRLVAVMGALGSDEISFAEGDKTVTQDPLHTLKSLLSELPKVVDYSQVDMSRAVDVAGDTANFAAPQGYQVDSAGLELDAKAKAFQAQNPQVSYIDAVKAVQG